MGKRWEERLEDLERAVNRLEEAISEEIYERIVSKYCSELRRNFEFLKVREI